MMKRFIALFSACLLLVSGCAQKASSFSEIPVEKEETAVQTEKTEKIDEQEIEESENPEEEIIDEEPASSETEWDLYAPSPSKNVQEQQSFTSLYDPELLSYVENTVYNQLASELDSDKYTIQNVSTTYISKEYLEELEYNSQLNVFFGYTLPELDEQFQGTRYVFTLGDNGETTVVPFEAYDDTYEKALKNVAIGTGIILIYATVAVATGGTGAYAINLIFAAGAKNGAVIALSSGALSAVMAGTVTGIKTGDFDEALKAGAAAGSEAFKWGAITGCLTAGASELVLLKIASSGGLTLNEAALIIKETGLPANFVKLIHSMDEYHELLALAEQGGLTIQEISQICLETKFPIEVVKAFRTTKEGIIYYNQAGLVPETVNGNIALIRTIDLSYQSELAGETVTNLERMRRGYAAIDPTSGLPFELHHIGQSVDSPFAILTKLEHTGGGNNGILHDLNIADGQGVHSLLSDSTWNMQKSEFWKALADILAK